MLIFLDASVMIVATLSRKGGSFRIIHEAGLRGYHLLTSRYAYREAEETIVKEYPEALPFLMELIQFITLTKEPSLKLIKKLKTIIPKRDAPVLAGALNGKVKALLTLNKKHFIENPKLKKKYPDLEIMTPGDFIKKYFL